MSNNVGYACNHYKQMFSQYLCNKQPVTIHVFACFPYLGCNLVFFDYLTILFETKFHFVFYEPLQTFYWPAQGIKTVAMMSEYIKMKLLGHSTHTLKEWKNVV
jgi:hypothetical protein